MISLKGSVALILDEEMRLCLQFRALLDKATFAVSQQLGFQEKMNDALRIAVAEAGLQAAHVKSNKGLRLRHRAKAEVRSGGSSRRLACLLAWRPCDGQRYHSRRRHYYISRYQPRQPPSADPACTTPADFTTTRDLTSIIIHAFLASTEQTPTSASRSNHGPTHATRWSPRRRAVRTVQARTSWLVADFLLGLHGTVY